MSAPLQAGSSVAEQLDAARRELAAGAVADAAARLEELRGRVPDDPRVAAGLARAYLKQGRVDAALAVAQDAVRRAPTAAVALLALGQARKAAHDLEGALDAFTRARSADDSPFACTQLGRAQLALGRAADALETARSARRRHADDAALLELEGDALGRLGRRDEAIAAFEAARALRPADPLAEKRLLEARLRELPATEALDELARLLQVPSYAERADVHELYGRFLHEAGRYAEAVAAFARLVALAPEQPFARRLLGFSAWKAGDAGRALQALKPVFLADPQDRFVRATVLAALAKEGRAAEAVALLEEALQAHPEAKGLYGELKRVRRRLEAPAPAAGTDPEREPASRPRRRAARRPPPEQLELGAPPPAPSRRPRGR